MSLRGRKRPRNDIRFLTDFSKNTIDNRKNRGKITPVYCDTAMTKSAMVTTQSEEGTVQALREPNRGSRFRAGLRRTDRPIPDTG